VLTNPPPTLYKLDHHYSATQSKTGIVAVLYAEPGTKEFLAFHRALKSLADTHAIDYVLRPFVVPVNKKYFKAGLKINNFFILEQTARSRKASSLGLWRRAPNKEHRVQSPRRF
jgi:hypothetical protein